MKTITGTILWIDDRTKHFEGQILGENNIKYYFNYSTCQDKPFKMQLLRFEIDKNNFALNIRDFLKREA